MAEADRPILVVEDDAAIRESVAAVLELDGYHVRTAADGAEALWAMEAQTPSLVILDLVMPGLDGPAFAAEVRSRGLDPPILVMSASHDPERAAREIGADGAMAKPFNINDLLAKVEQLRAA